MAAKKVRVKRRASKDTKGILLRNPAVAAQVGAAAGSLLAAMYAENPKILKNVEPVVDIFGRTREREDVLAYLNRMIGPKSRSRLVQQVQEKLRLLANNLHAGTHEKEGEKNYKAALDRQMESMMGALGVETWTRSDKKEK